MFLTSLKILHIFAQSLLQKEKYTSHTIVYLALFKCAFCHVLNENLLKGPALIDKFNFKKPELYMTGFGTFTEKMIKINHICSCYLMGQSS